MKKIIIFGNSDFSKMMRYFIEKYTDMIVSAYTADKEYIKDSEFDNIPLVPFEEISVKYPASEYGILIAAGFKKMNTLRNRVYKQVKEWGYKVEGFIHPKATIETEDFGEGLIVLANTYIGPWCKIGVCNIFMENMILGHYITVGDFNYLSNATIGGHSKVGNNCFIGMGAIVNTDIEIADFTLVGAGAYVKKSTNVNDVIVPARSVTLDGKKSIDLI